MSSSTTPAAASSSKPTTATKAEETAALGILEEDDEFEEFEAEGMIIEITRCASSCRKTWSIIPLCYAYTYPLDHKAPFICSSYRSYK
jgi:hypothetical protein